MNDVTVIIPVYNSEKYIGKCLDSILSQTYKKVDILIINDGSKDNSQSIINSYKEKNDNIISVEQKNIGVAKTRNKAINMVKTKYTMFIDNDDFIDKDYIQKHIEVAEEGEYDIVLSGYRRPNEKEKIIKRLSLKDEEWSKFMIFAPWAKIYRTDYLINNHIEFLDNNIGEDVYFNLQAMLLTKKIKIIDYIGYNWFYNTKSVSNTIQKDIRNIQVYNLLDNCYDVLNKKNVLENNYEIIEMYFIRYIIWFLLFSTKKLDYKVISNEYDKIFKWLKTNFTNFENNGLIGISRPKGEVFSIRAICLIFMFCHKIGIGKILVYLMGRF